MLSRISSAPPVAGLPAGSLPAGAGQVFSL